MPTPLALSRKPGSACPSHWALLPRSLDAPSLAPGQRAGRDRRPGGDLRL